ncbi:MAG: glycoside hydrolase family 3 C-terminal domain-containing protein [Solirubrobacterales bacterium]|nr:glycoside hydrolase family 3 C-terminal domain-containing protein [Solirubrobacterales bacterium]
MAWPGGRKFIGGLVLAALAFLVLAGPASAAGRCGNQAERPWCNTNLSPEKRAGLLIAAMTPEQRTSMLGGDDTKALASPDYTGIADGIPELGIPPLLMADGPVGIRVGNSTAMPSSMALGATFNPRLARRYGAVLGAETRGKGNDMLFGPNVDIMRTPLAGRSFENFGEDPFLTSALAVPYINGVQSKGVIATVKHFIGNNQEGWAGEDADRAVPGASPAGLVKEGSRNYVDARIGERAMREIYMPPFEAAIRKADPGAVMCAYNKVNTEYACENKGLLDGRLRKQLGFKGMIVADYLAIYDTAKAVKAGLDMEPWPGIVLGVSRLNQAIQSGELTQADIDLRARQYLTTLFRYGLFDRAAYVRDEEKIDWTGHDKVAREVGAQSLTLLKNDGLLPLKKSAGQSVALIGPGATQVIKGGGSSGVIERKFTSPAETFTARLGAANVTVLDGSDHAAAVAAARNSDVAIVLAANYMTEFVDRRCLSLECPPAYGDQDALIRQVAAANPKTVVVLETGAPVLTPWRGKVAALISAWYPGQSPGPVLADMLYGRTDPSGRLPVTFPRRESQIPLAGQRSLYPGINNVLGYGDGVNVGYRSYRHRAKTPAYFFGFGLSYTKFKAERLERVKARHGEFARLRIRIRNSGRRSGYAVPQLYLRLSRSGRGAFAPIRLVGFAKVRLKPGERKYVSFGLSRRDLSVYRPGLGKWVLATRCPRISFGWSSKEIHVGTTLGAPGRCRR